MRILTCIGLALTVLAQPACSRRPSVPARQSLRVVTWNIRGPQADLDAIVAELRGFDADLVCLQEALVEKTGGKGDQVARIAAALGMKSYSAGSALGQGAEQHMAILSTFPITGGEPLDAGTGRTYGVTARISLNGRDVRVVCVHLTASYRLEARHVLQTGRSRSKEATDLAKRLGEWSEPVVLAGDFNTTPRSAAYERLAKGLREIPTTQPTYPAWGPQVRIDHVLFSKELGSAQARIGDSKASDHLPVFVECAANGR